MLIRSAGKICSTIKNEFFPYVILFVLKETATQIQNSVIYYPLKTRFRWGLGTADNKENNHLTELHYLKIYNSV